MTERALFTYSWNVLRLKYRRFKNTNLIGIKNPMRNKRNSYENWKWLEAVRGKWKTWWKFAEICNNCRKSRGQMNSRNIKLFEQSLNGEWNKAKIISVISREIESKWNAKRVFRKLLSQICFSKEVWIYDFFFYSSVEIRIPDPAASKLEFLYQVIFFLFSTNLRDFAGWVVTAPLK